MATEPEVMQPTGGEYPPGYGGTVPQSDELHKTLKSQGAKGGINIVKATDDPIQGQLVSWSNEYNSTPEEILRTNNITNTSDIRPGQELAIPKGGGAENTFSLDGENLSIAPGGTIGDEDPMLDALLSGVNVKEEVSNLANEAFAAEGLPFGGEAEIPGEEPGAVPDQNAALDDNTGEPADDSGTVLETIQNYVIAFLDSKGFPMDASTGSDIDKLVKESTPYVEGAIEEAIDIGKATLPIRIGEGSKYTMGGGPGGAEETINEFVEEIGEKIIVGTKAVINPEEGDESSFVNRFINAETEKAPEVIPTEDLTKSEPAIAEGTSAAIVPASKTTTETVINKPPPQDELLRLQALYKPLGTGEDYFKKVILGLKAVPMPTEFDAAATYKQLAEDAVRDTKKIDDRIAEIAEEKIKPTFKGFDKFLAVLGASLGAYASAMTGTPNFALNIINKAIDADQEQFLASKDIRTKSLLDQRQAVLQRRSDLLQLAINQADRMLKAVETQRGRVLDVASLEGTKLALENAAKESHNAQITMLIENQVAKITLTNTQDLAKSKDHRVRSVNSIEVTNGDGETVVIPGYLAPTEKAAGEQVLIREQSIKINTLLTSMHDLYTNENNWLPSVINESAVKLEQDQKELLLMVKNINKMGANFTVPEIEMITATIPTTDISGKLSTGLIKIKKLRNKYISDQEATMQSFGYTKMPNAANEKKKAKGQTTIYKAP